MRRYQAPWLGLILVLLLSACSAGSPEPTLTENSPQITQKTSTPTSQPTSTKPLPVGILLKPAEADPVLDPDQESWIKEQIRGQDMRYQVRESLSTDDFQQDDIRFAVVIPPYPGLSELAASAPGTNFLAIGFDDLEAADNLSVIHSGKENLDHQGFMAGYIAAMITPDWRVAAVGLSDNEAAAAARQGFVSGAKYLCGLCLPKYAPTGPNYLYPKYVELNPEGTPGEHQAEVQVLLNRAVETIYLIPGAAGPDLVQFLVSSDAVLIGDGREFEPEFTAQWAASLSFDLAGAVSEYFPKFLEGSSGEEISVPLVITDVNPELLSPGRLLAAQEILEEVSAGWISTGGD